jgi:UDP-N-acetylmuramate--alanine ligase
LGARICAGHAAEYLPADASLAIYSDAVPSDNVERRQAAVQRIPLLSYAEMLAELGRHRPTLAIAGTHGKSTVTAMTAAALIAGGFDPTVICGAVPRGDLTGGRAGAGPLLVEACEYRANFLRLSPRIAVVLGIEPDHFDCYKSTAALHEAFARFMTQVPAGGTVLFQRGCPVARKLARKLTCRRLSFGLSPRADWSAQGLQTRRGCYRFRLVQRGSQLADIALQVPGRHNVVNAIAAMAAAVEAGAPAEVAAAAIGQFRGLRRRLEQRGTVGGVTLIDDYAHHPTAVRAGLATVRRMYPGRRICCVFEPHQASRTVALLDELAASLHNADQLAVAEIYRARESATRPGEVTAADLAAKVRASGGEVWHEHDLQDIQQRLERELRPGDVLLTMGAGDIGRITQSLVQRLRAHCAPS